MAASVYDANTKVTWLTSLASTTSPSAAALEAGVDLEGFITQDGLNTESDNAAVDTSTLNTVFNTERPGRASITIEITFVDHGRGNPPRSTFTGRPAGYLVVRKGMPSADAYAAGQHVAVYPVQAGDPNLQRGAANEVEKVVVGFFPTSSPNQDATTAA